MNAKINPLLRTRANSAMCAAFAFIHNFVVHAIHSARTLPPSEELVSLLVRAFFLAGPSSISSSRRCKSAARALAVASSAISLCASRSLLRSFCLASCSLASNSVTRPLKRSLMTSNSETRVRNVLF